MAEFLKGIWYLVSSYLAELGVVVLMAVVLTAILFAAATKKGKSE